MCYLFTAISAFIWVFFYILLVKNISIALSHMLRGNKDMWAKIHICSKTMGILRVCIQTKHGSWCKIITQLSHRGIKRMTWMINCFSFSTSARHTGETGLFFSEIQNINHSH